MTGCRQWGIFLGSLAVLGLPSLQAEEDSAEPALSAIPVPEEISEDEFSALLEASPFNRVLNFAETYALRGVASFEDIHMATLYHRDKKKTIVVSPEGKVVGELGDGLSLVEIIPADTLEGVSAKIAFAGEEVELKYEASQIFPKGKSPGGASQGDGRPRGPDGKPKGPSKEDIDRFRSLPPEKQARLREYIGHVMKSYPNMSRQEKGNLIRGAMIKLTDGREIEFPQQSGQGQ